MAYQTIFQRYELKYLLSTRQKDLLAQVMRPYMALDRFGHSTIRNIYYDTDTYRLIRNSLEKPAYKEKLRVRSYAKANEKSAVFVELKKKYKSVVYKRRIVMPEQQAVDWLGGKGPCPQQNQISREIDYFRSFYETLHPVVCLSYEREAFYSLGGDDFRVTFDENILYREKDLSLETEVYGTPLLQDGKVLMELKTPGGIPLWMTHFLTEQHIRKTSFSKYGTAYQMMQTNSLGGKLYA
jgi:SPX domain protein involved in polyphosphate accumulation